MTQLKLLTIFSVATVMVTTVTPVALAQSETPYQERVEERQALFEENSQERQENRQERQTQIQENAQERQENRQDRREERRDNIAQFHATRLHNRFGFYTQRLTTLASKIDTKLNQMATEGKDVTQAQATLNEAKTALDNAESLSNQAITAFEAIEPAEYETQRDQALAASNLAQQARESYKTAVSLMKEAVTLAKNA